MYFPAISKQALEEALTFVLSFKQPGLKVTLMKASQEKGEMKEGELHRTWASPPGYAL